MSTCCDTKDAPVARKAGTLTIALAGNPNAGKTTIFNALTGLRQKVGNYPGITVERKVGQFRLPDGSDAQLIDVPGTYSLISRSPDEVVAMEILRGLRADTPRPDLVIVVVDASNLQRNLYLVSQLIEVGYPMVVALNMMDVAARRGLAIIPEQLEVQLGVPVIPVVGHKKEGIDELKAAISRARVASMPDWHLPEAMREELAVVGGGLAILDSETKEGISAPSLHTPPKSEAKPDQARLDRYCAIAERLLVGDHAADLEAISHRQPVQSMLESAGTRMSQIGIDPMQADIEAHYRWIEEVAANCTHSAEELASMGDLAPGVLLRHDVDAVRATFSERVDSVLMHRIWGMVIFALIMGSLFVSIFWLAQPIMEGLQNAIAWLGDLITSRLGEGPLRALLQDGVFKGVGGVVVFVPQIALLFLFLSILEDSGYLARAAFLMDRIFSRLGLHGKSFIPLLSAFACAIPGVMATRTIENRKDRLATILIAPFMSCSARLPVYTLLIGVFFASYGAVTKAGIMLSLYVVGILAAAGSALLFKSTLLKGPAPAFILELPPYKLPQASQCARQVLVNSWEFLRRAGTLIFAMSVILWAMSYYPRLPESQRAEVSRQAMATGADPGHAEQAVSSAQQEFSVAGRLGHAVEPVLRPLGYDWKIGVGLVGAFAAREVFVSTLAITYATNDEDLATAMRNDTFSARYGELAGRKVWTPLVACSVMVWFVLAMQCMSTLAVVRRETGSWRWPAFMLVYMNGLAYVICLVMYQVGSRL